MSNVELAAFIGKVKKEYGDGVLDYMSSRQVLSRFSSGVFSLDLALGGGYPWGRITLLHGRESSGKSTLALKACSSVQNYCRKCRLEKSDCKCSFTPCIALYVDAEGSFDIDWAKSCGMDVDLHTILRPNKAEDAVDLMVAAVSERVVDLVVLDSIAALVPTAEIDKSSGDLQPGVHAKLMASFFRKVNRELLHDDKTAPTIIALNQQREAIGVMFGNPLRLPGGRAQHFFPSIKIALHTSKVTDEADEKMSAYAVCKGVVEKNKTYVRDIEFAFELALRDVGYAKKADVLNAEMVYKYAKQLDLCKKTWVVPGTGEEIKVKLDTEMIMLLHSRPDLLSVLWKQVMEKSLK